MKKQGLLLGSLAGLAVAAVCVLTASASGSTPAARETTSVVHEAAFTCGVDPPGATSRILPGQYATSVAICNRTDRPVRFRIRAALTFPDALGGSDIEGGLVSEPMERTLQPRQALQVDCGEVPSEFFPGFQGPPYVQGFLLIESRGGLGVSTVHTAGRFDELGNAEVVSIDVEQIEPRRR